MVDVTKRAKGPAGPLALIGSALAIPAGLLPAYGMTSIIRRWTSPEYAAIVVGLTAIAYIATWLYGLFVDEERINQICR